MRQAPIAWENLAARQGAYAPNRELPNDVTAESLHRGWTTQQPYAHLHCVVAPVCVLCGGKLDARNWGAHDCPVDRAIGDRIWAD